jgi:hypothetical protein
VPFVESMEPAYRNRGPDRDPGVIGTLWPDDCVPPAGTWNSQDRSAPGAFRSLAGARQGGVRSGDAPARAAAGRFGGSTAARRSSIPSAL